MPAKPTSRQLSYLKTLANQRGQSFAYPHTAAEASREINRLKRTRPDSYADQRRERKQIADAIQAGPADAARVRTDEIHGYGSSATWTQNHHPEPTPVQDPGPARARRRPVVGRRTELGSYTAGGQRRLIVGQRVDGVVRVSDVPDGTKGRAYLIERELETNTELQGLVADYLARAQELGVVPMAVVPVEARA